MADGRLHFAGQMVGPLKKAAHLFATEIVAECLNAFAVFVFVLMRVAISRRPRMIRVQQKNEGRLAGRRGAPELLFGDRESVRIAMFFRRNIPIAKGKHANIDIGLVNVLETGLQGSVVACHVVFHGDHVVTRLPQGIEYGLPVILQVFVSRGEINRDHDGMVLVMRDR